MQPDPVVHGNPCNKPPTAVFDRLWLVLALLSGAEAWAQARAGKTPAPDQAGAVVLTWCGSLVAMACPVA